MRENGSNRRKWDALEAAVRGSSNDGQWDFDVSVGFPVCFGFGISKQWTLLIALKNSGCARFLCRRGKLAKVFVRTSLLERKVDDNIRHAARGLPTCAAATAQEIGKRQCSNPPDR
jgi:hypothetical protein